MTTRSSCTSVEGIVCILHLICPVQEISIVLHLKLTTTLILKELYSIEKSATILDIFSKILELTVCRIIKIN